MIPSFVTVEKINPTTIIAMVVAVAVEVAGAVIFASIKYSTTHTISLSDGVGFAIVVVAIAASME